MWFAYTMDAPSGTITVEYSTDDVTEYDESSVGQKLADTAAYANFKLERATVEVAGLCAECANKPNGEPCRTGGA